MWTIERYNPAQAREWNDFNSRSRNATFLTDRGYMDYHSDRFTDHSLIARKNGKIMALLPANITTDCVLHSHSGLTYGGWILPQRHFDAADMLEVFDAMINFGKSSGIKEIDYKPLPYIFASAPSGEDRYALWRHGAVMTECNISATIKLSSFPGFTMSRRQRLRKALAMRPEVRVTDDPDDLAVFHSMLCQCLAERHDVAPVHSLDELRLLKSRFPNQICLVLATVDEEIQAGTLLYISKAVVHAQYIATTSEGRRNSMISPLFDKIISLIGEGFFGKEIEYLDFGTSNEDHGRYLNDSLYEQKASMGATGVAYERFSLKL